MEEEGGLRKIVVIMTGPMLSGKTCMAQCIKRIFSWQGRRTKLVTVLGYIENGCQEMSSSMMDMIDIDNLKGHLRKNWDITIFDGPPSTRNIRRMLKEKIEDLGYQAIYVEIAAENEVEVEHKAQLIASAICNDSGFSGEYTDVYNKLMSNSRNQVENHETIITSEGLSFIIVGANGEVHAHNIVGEIGTKIAMIVMTVNTACHKKIFLVQGNGKMDLDLVRETINQHMDLSKAKVWVDPYLIQDGLIEKIHPHPLYISRLCRYERKSPMIQGHTKEKCAYEHEEGIKCNDPCHYNGKGIESYQTLIDYLEGLIIELLGEDSDVVVLCDAAVARCIYGFFMDISPEYIPTYPICQDFIIMIEQRLHPADNNVPNDGTPFQFVHFCLFSTQNVQKSIKTDLTDN